MNRIKSFFRSSPRLATGFVLGVALALAIPAAAFVKRNGHWVFETVTIVDAATLSGTNTISGATTMSGATTHSAAHTDTSTYAHTGSGTHAISTTGAFTRSGASATSTFSETGAWTRSGTGVTTFSSSGANTFSGGDVTLSGADTDLALTGATSDLTISGGGDFTISSDGNIDVAGTGAYKLEGEVVIQCDTVTIATGELLALNATPKVLVAAPGANKFIAVQSVTLALDFNSAAYDGIAAGEDLSIQYVGGAVKVTQDIETTGFLDQGADTLRFINGAPQALAAAAAAAPLVPTVNAGIDITLLTDEIATGDSPLDVRICYSIQPSLLD